MNWEDEKSLPSGGDNQLEMETGFGDWVLGDGEIPSFHIAICE